MAEAAFYPRFTLGLNGRTQDTSLNLVRLPNSFWSVGPAISLPVFNGGLLRAEKAGVKAQFDAAAAGYKTVLDAFQEVEGNLARLHWLAQEAEQEGTAVRAALEAQQPALDMRPQQLTATVGLIRALAGGAERPPNCRAGGAALRRCYRRGVRLILLPKEARPGQRPDLT